MGESDRVWQRLRHDLRGGYHQVRLCTDALAGETNPAEQLVWLSHIEQAATRCEQVAAQIETCDLPEPREASAAPGSNVLT
jgi:hypothetical protein